VVLDDLDVISVTIAPDKADSPLIVYADAVLSLSVARQSFKAIPGGNAKIRHGRAAMKHSQFPEGDGLDRRRLPARELSLEYLLRFLAFEALDHVGTV
jgi:hypothetical protein